MAVGRTMRTLAIETENRRFGREFSGYNVENWPEMIDWICRHFIRLEETFSEPLARLSRQLKSGGDRLASAGNAPGSVSARLNGERHASGTDP